MKKLAADALKRAFGLLVDNLPWATLLGLLVGLATWAGTSLLAPVPRHYVVVGTFGGVAATLLAVAIRDRMAIRLTDTERKLLVLLQQSGGRVYYVHAAEKIGLPEPQFDLLVHKLWSRDLLWDWERDSRAIYLGPAPPRELQIRDKGKELLRKLLARDPRLLDQQQRQILNPIRAPHEMSPFARTRVNTERNQDRPDRCRRSETYSDAEKRHRTRTGDTPEKSGWRGPRSAVGLAKVRRRTQW